MNLLGFFGNVFVQKPACELFTVLKAILMDRNTGLVIKTTAFDSTGFRTQDLSRVRRA